MAFVLTIADGKGRGQKFQFETENVTRVTSNPPSPVAEQASLTAASLGLDGDLSDDGDA